ncbi:hypothetical protein MASR2M29_06860 [Spirochaetota bacterium]
MKKSKVLLAISLIFLTATAVFAQSRVNLTIAASEGPAQVMLDGKLVGVANPRLTVSVAPGSYTLIVRKSGLPEFKQTIVVGAGGLTVNAPLGSAPSTAPQTFAPPTTTANFPLNITSNISGADVIINNISVGKTPYNGSVPAGSYNVIVRAAGYNDYSQTVSVAGPSTVSANLSPLMVSLNLGNLIPGAQVIINGKLIGTAASSGSFVTQLAPGSYTLTIRAAGFMEFSVPLSVGSGGYSYNPVLQPLTAKYSINLPQAMLNPSFGSNPWSQIQVYVDDRLVSGNMGEVSPGRHSIRIVSGAFQITNSYNFEAGKTYIIEPFVGSNIR